MVNVLLMEDMNAIQENYKEINVFPLEKFVHLDSMKMPKVSVNNVKT